MLMSIKSTTLNTAMKLACHLITTGERVVAFSERRGANNLRARPTEMTLWRAGRVITFAGERLEACVNRVAMRLGYDDGELSEAAAWPASSAR